MLPILRASTLRSARAAQTRRYASTEAATEKREGLFKKILVANRGEIACRVISTAKKLGVKTVAVYSEADENALHVKLADEAFCLGPAPVLESYLRVDKILEVARETGAEAIHPGYGFLSENAGFANECASNGVTFIGPPASAINSMGSKDESKVIMEKAGVPCVPGYHGPEQSLEHFLKIAGKKDVIDGKEVSRYPWLLKANKGGGGKGMRIVHKEEDLPRLLKECQEEALSSFGDSSCLIEKYIKKSRHVEIQVFADNFGNVVYLFERDCSLQRRHQKVIEEAPAPHLSEEQRHKMGKAAVDAARAVNYRGAGTVEFIMEADEESPNFGTFYFMEMNTRLQVEHPITEMITGTDLVHWQLLVASGFTLPKKQEELKINGHAFEARICAENPYNDFAPSVGKMHLLQPPKILDSKMRVDTGVLQGDEVSVYYDSMIAKLVVWDTTRQTALDRLACALEQYYIAGPHTNISFLRRCATHPEFEKGNVQTHFIPEHAEVLLRAKALVSTDILAMTSLFLVLGENKATASKPTPWQQLNGRRFGTEHEREIKWIDEDEVEHSVFVTYKPNNKYRVRTFDREGKEYEIEGRAKLTENGIEVFHTGNRMTSVIHRKGDTFSIFKEGEEFTLELPTPSYVVPEGAGSLLAPLPGVVSNVFVKAGDAVKKGDVVMQLVSMKQSHNICSPTDGIVEAVFFSKDDNIAADDLALSFVVEEKE